MSKIVLDTNVLVSALLTPAGNPAKIYRMFLIGVIPLVLSDGIYAEYRDVLFRPRLRFPSDAVGTILAAIRQYGETIVPIVSSIEMVDEDDRVFYDTAKTAGAYLITGNTKHYPREDFILTPSEFLGL
ncbi:MAG: putative toxin-antitoxin system toxin component, PIN family [Oscillospiraceae bacterium]|jgi:putative PIN family toxin of toxin-antitoxin system|nr:putative toxin-antitoxin system toxin component, PIN family [Oscillospiraceae bacterium]